MLVLPLSLPCISVLRFFLQVLFTILPGYSYVVLPFFAWLYFELGEQILSLLFDAVKPLCHFTQVVGIAVLGKLLVHLPTILKVFVFCEYIFRS